MLFFGASFLKAQNAKNETIVYEYQSLYSGGDSSYIKSYFLNDSLQVRQVFFGHSFDISSIKEQSLDTFVIYKKEWKKILNGKKYLFLSMKDFSSKHSTIEYLRNAGAWNYRYKFTPVKKMKVDGEQIFVYDRDVIDYKNKVKSRDSRVYFSFKYGIVGYLNLNENMVMKRFLNKLKMELRERKVK